MYEAPSPTPDIAFATASHGQALSSPLSNPAHSSPTSSQKTPASQTWNRGKTRNKCTRIDQSPYKRHPSYNVHWRDVWQHGSSIELKTEGAGKEQFGPARRKIDSDSRDETAGLHRIGYRKDSKTGSATSQKPGMSDGRSVQTDCIGHVIVSSSTRTEAGVYIATVP